MRKTPSSSATGRKHETYLPMAQCHETGTGTRSAVLSPSRVGSFGIYGNCSNKEYRPENGSPVVGSSLEEKSLHKG
ncbi:hypothetical protein Hanom_Chr15g01359541 [Helianthus anomalus]